MTVSATSTLVSPSTSFDPSLGEILSGSPLWSLHVSESRFVLAVTVNPTESEVPLTTGQPRSTVRAFSSMQRPSGNATGYSQLTAQPFVSTEARVPQDTDGTGVGVGVGSGPGVGVGSGVGVGPGPGVGLGDGDGNGPPSGSPVPCTLSCTVEVAVEVPARAVSV